MIPAAYQEVEYIECYGGQYSAVPVTLQNGDSIAASVLVPTSAGSGEAGFIGADHNSGKAEIYHQSNSIKFWGTFSGTTISISRDTIYNVSANVTGSLNGVYIGSYQPTRYPFTGRIYAISAARSGVSLFELVPCYRKNDDVIGFYDNINAVFYTNDGSGAYGKGPDIITDFYTIHFNANGGSGSMNDQNISIDTYDYLSPCSFIKQGYEFAGWALSASGPVAYTDGAQVYNIAETGETVNLYAVWEKASLKCTLQYNKSENNKAVKEVENLRQFNFTLKEQTSIIDPVLLITGDISDMLQANYMTIPVFGRSYFITNITSIRTGLVEISAHVDVLSSYIEYIKECYAIVHRQENKWNLYLDDGFFKTYQNPNIVVKKFPNGFTDQSFVLAVAGN